MFRAWWMLLALLACQRGQPNARQNIAPVWATRGQGGATPIALGTMAPDLTHAEACRDCHAAIYDEWAQSRHALAWQNSIFATEYRAEPKAWCRNCHMPTDAQHQAWAAGDVRHADEGVGCAACHVRRGTLVSRTRHAESPHATLVDASFGSPAFCADCHEFAFPRFDEAGQAQGFSPYPMQATVSQFGRGPHARNARGCLACHATQAGHGFPGGHDAGMLARALTMTACRRGATLVIRLGNRGAGHDVPTGDVHRHIVGRAWRSSAPERLWELFVGRRFEPDDAGGKRTIWDSALPPGVTREFVTELAALGGEADEPINFELRFVYVRSEHLPKARTPTEPGWQILWQWRALATHLVTCGLP